MATPAPSETSEPSAPAAVSGYAWYVLGVLFVVTTFNVADRNILNVLLEPIKNEFGVEPKHLRPRVWIRVSWIICERPESRTFSICSFAAPMMRDTQ